MIDMLNEQDSKTNALIEQLRTYDSAFEREIADALEQLVAERNEWQRGEGIATNMVGELELEVTALKEVSDHHLRDVTNLCGHIAASEQRIKELEAEVEEQARLLSMSGEETMTENNAAIAAPKLAELKSRPCTLEELQAALVNLIELYNKQGEATTAAINRKQDREWRATI